MTWKQPIPTNLEEIFGNDTKGMVLYVFLLLNSANKDGCLTDKSSGRTVCLKRGQSVFGRDRYAKLLGCSPKTAERTLSKICLNSVLKMTKNATKSFTVVTFENYDEITKMTNKRPTNDQQMTTSKSVKSVKSDNTPISPKGKLYGGKYTLQEVGERVLQAFSASKLGNFKSVAGFIKNLEYWLSIYEPIEVGQAIEAAMKDDHWNKFLTPTILFRRKNQNHEDVDYIGKFLSDYKKLQFKNHYEEKKESRQVY